MTGLLRTRAKKLDSIMKSDHVKRVKGYLPTFNFITIHYLYFIATCLISSLIFWGSSDPSKSITYTDSLFLVVSAMTEAGLNTVNLSTMTTFQQFILWLLIVIGSSIFVSISTVLTRKRYFELRFKDVVKQQKADRRMHRRSLSALRSPHVDRNRWDGARKVATPNDQSEFQSRHSGPRDPTQQSTALGLMTEQLSDRLPVGEVTQDNGSEGTTLSSRNTVTETEEDRGRSPATEHITFSPMVPAPTSDMRSRVLNFQDVDDHPHTTDTRGTRMDGLVHRAGRGAAATKGGDEKDVRDDLKHWHYPNYLTRYTIGRNAQFFGLSRAEREHLGGVEYRAITLLAYVVPLYFFLWQFLGCVGLGAYMAHNKASTSRENGINPWWLGIFNGVSAFNNSGMSLLDANMIPFQTSIYTLITMGLMILAGNTAYPLFLRLILWLMLKVLCWIYPSDEEYSDHKATLRFVLQYPRRVYTTLFPSSPTWWLLFMLIVLNGIDWVAFEVINIGNPAVNAIPGHFRVLDGLFQALAVRSGGFYIISIPTLRIGLQVLYVIMMYISVYPVVITMRHSNVYEERSLGIYADDTEPSDEEEGIKFGNLMGKVRRTLTNTFTAPFPGIPAGSNSTTGIHFVRQQIRGQLAHDLWWLVLAVLFISIIEVSNFDRDPVTYSVFNILFEVVSGYGCVGISTGLPNEAYSFSGGWHVASKLILIAVMLRGRHRGLPVALDRAVQLPGVKEELDRQEEEQRKVRRRSLSMSRSIVGGDCRLCGHLHPPGLHDAH